MKKLLIAILIVTLMASLAFSGEFRKAVQTPQSIGDRFWVSSSGAANLTVTATDPDTLSGAGIMRSIPFDLWTQIDGMSVPAKEVWFFGIAKSTVALDGFPDSLDCRVIPYNNDASVRGYTAIMDTVFIDTTEHTGTGFWLGSNDSCFFMSRIELTDNLGDIMPYSGTFEYPRRVPPKGAIRIAAGLELTGAVTDTLQLRDCGVIVLW